MSEEGWYYTTKLREWMFENVYLDSPAKLEEGKARNIIRSLFEYYTDMLNPHCEPEKIERIVTDYISGMTDQYAIEKYKETFIPRPINAKTTDDAILRQIF